MHDVNEDANDVSRAHMHLLGGRRAVRRLAQGTVLRVEVVRFPLDVLLRPHLVDEDDGLYLRSGLSEAQMGFGSW